MTKQMTKKQLDALNVTLANYGLVARTTPKPRKPADAKAAYLAKIRAWKPATDAGRKCKRTMIFWAGKPVKGVSWYQGPDGIRHYLDGTSERVA